MANPDSAPCLGIAEAAAKLYADAQNHSESVPVEILHLQKENAALRTQLLTTRTELCEALLSANLTR